MTSNELKHKAKKQEWGIAIQECRGSGLSVSEWCRQRGVTTTAYYRWERELLTGVQRNGTPPSTTVTFAELPGPKRVREAYRVEQWRQLMQQRRDSPLNNREFCAQQGISEKSYYWLKKLRESAVEHGIQQLVALGDREKPDELRIEYHGASMVLPGHVDIDAVAAVLRSLQQA